MKSEITQLHIYIDNKMHPELAEKTMYLKNKRKLNKVIVELLREYFEKEDRQLDLFEIEKPS